MTLPGLQDQPMQITLRILVDTYGSAAGDLAFGSEGKGGPPGQSGPSCQLMRCLCCFVADIARKLSKKGVVSLLALWSGFEGNIVETNPSFVVLVFESFQAY